MPTYIQPSTIADVLIAEVHHGWTKENGVLAGGANYVRGTVLAKVAGKYQALDPASEVAAAKVPHAVLGNPVDATAGDAPGLVIARGAVVNEASLVWPEGITDAQKADALDYLELRGIVARTVL